MVANNVHHAIASQPILLHTVATVGGVMAKKAAINIYDFRDLKKQGAFAKHCLIWVLKIDDPQFADLWQEVREEEQREGSLE